MCLAHKTVNDNSQPCCFGYLPGLLRNDPHLEPQHLCSDSNGLPCDLRRFLGGSEHLHHVHRHVNLSERAEYALAEKLATSGVHRQDPVTLPLQVAWDLMSGLRLISRSANHRDRPGFAVDAQELLPLRGSHHIINSHSS